MNHQFDSPCERSCSLKASARPGSLSRGKLAKGLAQSVTRRAALKKFGGALTSLPLIAIWSAALSAFAQTYIITDLGTLPGDDSSAAYSINNAGQVVVASGWHAALWTPIRRNGPTGSLTDLGQNSPGGVFPVSDHPIAPINDSGQILFGTSLWTPSIPNGTSGTMTPLDSPGATVSSVGGGLNSAGVVVGVAYEKQPHDCGPMCWIPRYPASWTSGHGRLLDRNEGWATAINDAGQVFGAELGQVAKFWWPDGNSSPLSPAPPAVPGAINNFGQVIGSYGGIAPHYAFLWTPNTPSGATGALTDLGSLRGTSGDIYGPISYAYGLNGRGQVVGWSEVLDSNGLAQVAFLWSPTHANSATGQIRDLNALIPAASGWVLHVAYAINDVGQIVGGGTSPSGAERAFLLTPVSLPRLSAPSLQPGGRFGFTLVGEAGRSYTIEASSNLQNWIALTNFTSATGTNAFSDAAASNFNRRFYRAMTQ